MTLCTWTKDTEEEDDQDEDDDDDDGEATERERGEKKRTEGKDREEVRGERKWLTCQQWPSHIYSGSLFFLCFGTLLFFIYI